MFEASSANRLSAQWLAVVASRLLSEAGALVQGGRTIATLTIDGEIRFGSAADRAAFADELGGFLTALAGRYHDETSADGRRYRVVVAVHPVVHPVVRPAVKET
jgi:hypothetical protein